MNEFVVDFKELEEKKRRNKEERLQFIDWYVEWIKKTPNNVWSKAHADFIDSCIIINNEWAKGKTKEQILESL